MNVVPGTSTGWYSLLGRVFWHWDISLLFQVFVSGTQLCRLFLSSVEVLIWWSPGKQACCDWTSSLVRVVLGCVFLYLVVLSRLRWICNHAKASAITSFMFPYSVLHVWFNWGVWFQDYISYRTRASDLPLLRILGSAATWKTLRKWVPCLSLEKREKVCISYVMLVFLLGHNMRLGASLKCYLSPALFLKDAMSQTSDISLCFVLLTPLSRTCSSVLKTDDFGVPI